MSPAFQFNVGDVIETYEGSIGMITSRSNAHEYMAFDKNLPDEVIRSYMHIPIYKTLIDGNITYVNESNIKGIVAWEEERKK